MSISHKITNKDKKYKPLFWLVGYWFICALLLVLLAWGVNMYFEHRIRELDKRLEHLK